MVRRIAVLAWLSFTGMSALASTIDFETLPNSTAILDGTAITTQFPGLIFTNTTVLTAGVGLNEVEFPPHSGTNAAFDDGGPVMIAFDSPISSFGGYFTYLEPLTLTAFDSSNAMVGSAHSTFLSNDALYGDAGSSADEFLQVAYSLGISGITITGDSSGSSFVMDDLTYTESAVPEPTTLSLVAMSTFSLGVFILKSFLDKKHYEKTSSCNWFAARHRG